MLPSSYQLCSTLLAEDAILIVKGRLDRREDVAKIIAMEVTQPDLTVTDATGPFSVTLPLGRCTPPRCRGSRRCWSPTRAPPRSTCTSRTARAPRSSA